MIICVVIELLILPCTTPNLFALMWVVSVAVAVMQFDFPFAFIAPIRWRLNQRRACVLLSVTALLR